MESMEFMESVQFMQTMESMESMESMNTMECRSRWEDFRGRGGRDVVAVVASDK